jgi:hypothetical protein
MRVAQATVKAALSVLRWRRSRAGDPCLIISSSFQEQRYVITPHQSIYRAAISLIIAFTYLCCLNKKRNKWHACALFCCAMLPPSRRVTAESGVALVHRFRWYFNAQTKCCEKSIQCPGMIWYLEIRPANHSISRLVAQE